MKTNFTFSLLAFSFSVIILSCNSAGTGKNDGTPYKQEDGLRKTTEPDRDWEALTTLSGSGNKTSEVFEVMGSQVKLITHTQSANGSDCFLHCIMIESGKTIESDPQAQIEPFDTKICGDTEKIIFRGGGKYFFEIEGRGDWRIEIFEK